MRGLKVAHTNFSEETIGEFYAELYSSEDSKCIKCLRRNCNGIFTPREFCMHYHGLIYDINLCYTSKFGYSDLKYTKAK